MAEEMNYLLTFIDLFYPENQGKQTDRESIYFTGAEPISTASNLTVTNVLVFGFKTIGFESTSCQNLTKKLKEYEPGFNTIS